MPKDKSQFIFLNFILKEWLFSISAVGIVLTSFFLGRIPKFSHDEMHVVFLLFVLFITVKGIQQSGLLSLFSVRMESGRLVVVKLVLLTYLLSMVVTNDVALVIIVPLTLAMDISRKDLVVILEALAANAGSALTPFGNPQNLYIYWHYKIYPVEFVSTIAPFSFVFLFLLTLSSIFIKVPDEKKINVRVPLDKKSAIIYLLLLAMSIVIVLRILPIEIGVIVIAYAAFFDRKSLKVDYILLLTFVCFFGLADNLKLIFFSELVHSRHIFIFSAISSQIISNVPAAILFAKFTVKWKALLWGTNVGGFGGLMGSLANLIAYKFYVSSGKNNNQFPFLLRFTILAYVAFFVGIALFFILYYVLV